MVDKKSVSEVYIHKNALSEAKEYAKRAAPNETLGFMLGKVKEWKGQKYVVIERIVTAETDSTQTSTKFKTESLGKVADEIMDDEIIIGWYHSHPGHGCFLSETDIITHTQQFYNPYNVALVIDPVRGDFKFFKTDDEGNCWEVDYELWETWSN